MTWHADQLLDAYRRRGLDAVATASVDTHLVGCARCQGELRRLDDNETQPADDTDLWAAIVDEIDRPALTLPERVLGRLGLPDHVGRLVAATHSLAVAAALAVVVSLFFGVLAADRGRDQDVALFLALAAVVPLVGVAAAYGPVVDPTHEVAAASPLSGLRLVLFRTVAVVAVAVPIGLIGSVALLDDGLVAVAWLLPGLALAAATLALATYVTPWRAAAVVVVVWFVGIAASGRVAGDWLAPFGSATQVVALAVFAVAAAVLTVRAPRLDHREI